MIYNLFYLSLSLSFSLVNVLTIDESEEDYEETTNSTNSSLQLLVGLKNISRSAGKNLKLTCTVLNSDINNTNVNFTWKKNEVLIDKSENRFKYSVSKVRDGNLFLNISFYTYTFFFM